MQPPLVKIRPLVAERKLSRRLFEQLAEQIKSGKLTPGSRLARGCRPSKSSHGRPV